MFDLLTPEQEAWLNVIGKVKCHRLWGFTIAIVRDKLTVGYWDRDHISSRMDVQYPQLFILVRALNSRRKKLMEYGYDARTAFWTHDDMHVQPLEKYMELYRQFPGCPRH